MTCHSVATLHSKGDSLPRGEKKKKSTLPFPGTGRKYQKGRGVRVFVLLQKGEATLHGYLSAVDTRLYAVNVRLNERNAKNIQRLQKRIYYKYSIAARFSTLGEIKKGPTWQEKANYYFASIISLYHPRYHQIPEKKQLSLRTISAVLDPLYDPVIGHTVMTTALSVRARELW